MGNIHLQRATLTDLQALQRIGRQTFSETFAVMNTEENMANYLAEGFSEEKLGAELRNPDSVFYFAQEDERVVGYLKLNFGAAQTEIREHQGVEIERIYVLAAYQGQKVGQLLYEKAMAVARERQAAYVWLGVWEKNERALRFYRKNGFVTFGQHLFQLGDDVQTDLLMRLSLS